MRRLTRADWLALLFVTLAFVLASTVDAQGGPLDPTRECFPKDRWGPAPDRLRPCATVTSYTPVCVRVSAADGSHSAGACLRVSSTGTDHSVRIVRLYEDGSVCLRVARALRPVTRCVGNPRD